MDVLGRPEVETRVVHGETEYVSARETDFCRTVADFIKAVQSVNSSNIKYLD